MFAENLKKIRKDKGYTQEILAEKLNVVRQTVSKWEKGLSLPDVDMLSKIANVLETDVNILLDGQITTTDQSEIVKQLAKINEQLTIKNRRYKKIMKTIAIILLIIVIYGILLGVLTGLFRFFGTSAEGVSYAIIISNLLVPLIDKLTLKGGVVK